MMNGKIIFVKMDALDMACAYLAMFCNRMSTSCPFEECPAESPSCSVTTPDHWDDAHKREVDDDDQ